MFESDGRYVSADEESRRPRRVNYINQVNAANLFAKRLVDGILARAPSPPVIILQGDEGPYPAGTGSDDRYNWRTATPQDVRETSGILNAYYLPAGRRSALYASISPVDSFRVVFNAYFGTQLEMLPDQVCGHESETHPYTFFDPTDAVNRASVCRRFRPRTALPPPHHDGPCRDPDRVRTSRDFLDRPTSRRASFLDDPGDQPGKGTCQAGVRLRWRRRPRRYVTC